jgi:hypothetical protein
MGFLQNRRAGKGALCAVPTNKNQVRRKMVGTLALAHPVPFLAFGAGLTM